MKFSKTIGFTLAEVLITLGIIGVVATMTIPTIIANTKIQQYRAHFKKTISTLSQAARMSQAQYGFDYAGINQKCGTNAATENPNSVMSICAIFNGTLTGITYYKSLSNLSLTKKNNSLTYKDSIIKGDFFNAGPARDLNNFQAYTLSDGSIVGINKNLGTYNCTLAIGSQLEDIPANGDMFSCNGFIDVNGTSLPNKEVTCSSGSNSTSKNDCIVKNDAQHMTDIYPIRFHDGIVEPATAAGRYILRTTK